ncbi:hypothetical protein [Rubritalea marina]|uniref:hypothetical protein n=1 Tax=Rubritalea marina TaxID=361055 RepID=UPI0003629DC9|nr:hypothetical protein [Rubritalea marina]
MAHHVTSQDIPANGEQIAKKDLSKVKLISLLIFVAGAIASFLLFSNETWGAGYAYSWLFAFIFFITLTLGGVFWTTLHHVTNSGWGVSIRRIMENLGFVFPFFAVIAIPLMIPSVQDDLYEWMNRHRYVQQTVEAVEVKVDGKKGYEAKVVAGTEDLDEHAPGGAYKSPEKAQLYATHEPYDHLLKVKKWYMSLENWLTRVILFFVVLGAGIFFLRKFSIDQDKDPNPTTRRLILTRKLSCAVMPFFAVIATFIAFDFMMGTDYKWFSTMYGVWFFAGCALNSMAVLILTLTWLRSKGYLTTVTSQEHYHIMGKLMHAFVIFWAYVSFSQFMLIWYANITEETTYFLLRNSSDGSVNWNLWSTLLVFLHFALPFAVLLPHYMKKKVKFVVPICIYLLVMHILDLYIAIIPERGPSLSVMNKFAGHEGEILLTAPHKAYLGDIVAFITVGAFFVFVFVRNLGSANTYPNRDPRILESANLHN